MLAIVTKRPHSLDTEIRLEQSNNSCEGDALGDGEGSRDLYPILSTGFFLHVGADMQAVRQWCPMGNYCREVRGDSLEDWDWELL